MDGGKLRLIVRVATGRKFWPIISQVVHLEQGIEDEALLQIKACMKLYTHPMVDRFISELEVMLSDLYQIEISLSKL